MLELLNTTLPVKTVADSVRTTLLDTTGKSEIEKKIYKVLPERGIKFPFPQLSVHMD